MVRFLLSLSIIFGLFTGLFADEPAHGHEPKKELSKEERKTEIKKFIDHHIADSHDFVFFEDSKKHKYYGFHLPVILWDNGLKVFSSSKFHWGHEAAEIDGNFYWSHHGKVYKTSSAEHPHFDAEGHPSNAERVRWDFSLTKNLVFIFIISGLVFWLFVKVAKSYKKGLAPSGIAKFMEPIVLYVRDEIAIPNIGEDYKRYMPYLLTVFFFIWIANLFGLTPLGSNVTNSIAVTSLLAIITFILTQFTATKTYWKHLVDPLGDSMPWLGKLPIYIMLVPVEILGIFIKPFALLIRLYANITAGHIVMMSLIGLIFIFQNILGGTLSFGLTLAISLIELLVAALQAYIFTMLSALYFGMAREKPHDH